MKPIWKSKTVWFGIVVALIPFLGDLLNVLQDGAAPGWLVALIGLIILALRFVTGQKVSFKKSDPQLRL